MAKPVVERTSARDSAVEGTAQLRELADAAVFTVFQRVASSPRGLTESDAAERLRNFGDNEPFRAKDEGTGARVVAAFRSPFVALLAALGVVFLVVGDARGAGMVGLIVGLAVVLRIWQQTRSVRAGRELRKLVTCTVTVRRRADADHIPADREV